MKLPDNVYNVLKWICLVFLPAISTLYFALANIWGFPYVTEIVGTIAAVETFLGALIGISTISYNLQNKQQKELNK